MKPRRLLSIGAGLAALAHGLAALEAKRIQSKPSPVSYEELRAEPEAEVHVVERPDGTRIHAREAGTGATIVLAHGYGVTTQTWNLVWRQLREWDFRCVAFDLRGHGRSTIGSEGIGSKQMAEDYAAVFEALGIDDAVLVGHSTGGFLAIRALLDVAGFADRVRGFVALGTLAGEVLRGSPQNRLQTPLIKLGVMQAVSRSSTYSWLFGASLSGREPSPAAIRLFNEIFAAQPHRELVPLMQALASESRYDRLHELAVPTVVVCGDRDRSTPRWHSEQLGVRIPNARNVWLPGMGHLLNWEAPEAIVEAVISLLGDRPES